MKFRPFTTSFLLLTLTLSVVRPVRAESIVSPPQIANGRAVWTVYEVTDSVQPGEIYLYDATSGVIKRLTKNVLDDSSPRIDDEKIVWVQVDGEGTSVLMIYDLATGETNKVSGDFVWGDSPQVDGDLTVLTRFDGENREIVVQSASLKSETEITENQLEDTYPGISGTNITWVRGEGESSEIIIISESSGGFEGQVTENGYEDAYPCIEGDQLTWQGHVDGDWEIFVHHIDSEEDPVQITENTYDDISPQTDGDHVVWLGYSNSGGGIFLYDISTETTFQVWSEAGDSDCSGDVDLADVIVALQVFSGVNEMEICISADVNGDDKIGLAEILFILQSVGTVR